MKRSAARQGPLPRRSVVQYHDPTVTTPRQTSNLPVAIGVLLAGGEARRMGFDKRTLQLGGATLVERGVAALREVFPIVAVSLRAGADPGLVPSGCEIVHDEVPGSPLTGIVSALAHYHVPIFVLAADMPFAERAAIKEVVEAFDDVDVALPVVDGHVEPLHAVYGPGCLPPIRRLLAAGNHRIPDLYSQVRVAEVPFASSALFFSVNTPTDLEDARRRLDRRAGRLVRQRRPRIARGQNPVGSVADAVPRL